MWFSSNMGNRSYIKLLSKDYPTITWETKVWQYVSLTKRIYLIDCPVYDEGSSQNDKVLRSVVKAEKIEEPIEFINGILERVEPNILKLFNN